MVSFQNNNFKQYTVLPYPDLDFDGLILHFRVYYGQIPKDTQHPIKLYSIVVNISLYKVYLPLSFLNF